MRILLFSIGCMFVPFFYIGFFLAGMYTPIGILYKDIFNHYKSGEPFGGFDGGLR